MGCGRLGRERSPPQKGVWWWLEKAFSDLERSAGDGSREGEGWRGEEGMRLKGSVESGTYLVALLSALHTGSADFTQPLPAVITLHLTLGPSSWSKLRPRKGPRFQPHQSQDSSFIPQGHVMPFLRDLSDSYVLQNWHLV